MMNPVAKLLTSVIRWYQRTISINSPRRCRYQPTCSQYAVESIQVHGSIKGTLLSVWRILRCNPWSAGGVDWVPKKGKWPSKPLGYKELLAHRAKEEQEKASGQYGHGDAKPGQHDSEKEE